MALFEKVAIGYLYIFLMLFLAQGVLTVVSIIMEFVLLNSEYSERSLTVTNITFTAYILFRVMHIMNAIQIIVIYYKIGLRKR